MQSQVDVQHYQFRLALSDRTNAIAGETTVELIVKKNNLESFWLDLIGRKQPTDSLGMRVLEVLINGNKAGFSHRSDRVYINLPYGQPADTKLKVSVKYDGIPTDGLVISKNHYGERTFFGDNWPNRARHWLPVVDHPSDKATCEFQVIAPSHYRVISNGKLIEETQLTGEQTLTHWFESIPIPTKVMVIGAARFAVKHEATVQCIPIQSWVFPLDRQAGFYDYSHATKILEFFIEKIGPYSYEKLANVQSKTIFGGMENASCIFYNENAIYGTPSTRMQALLAHEIAHQWFGNSASERDWSHIWLSESFATYCSALYLEHLYGRDTLNSVLAENKGAVLRYAKLSPNTPIVDSSRKDLMELLNANSYEKGGWILHTLRRELGDERFWKVLSKYYATYQNANAITADFQAVVEQVTNQSWAWFFDQWLYQPGLPELTFSWKYDSTLHKLTVQAEQTQATKHTYNIPIDLSIEASGKLISLPSQRMTMRKQQWEIDLTTTPGALLVDPQRWVLMLSKVQDMNKK